MNKLILILALTISTNAVAATCANGTGTELTGKYKYTYCQSHISMNWWSAFAWCNSIGSELIDITEDCVPTGTPTSGSEVHCPNLYGIGSGIGWTQNVPNNEYAYFIDFNSGKIRVHDSGTAGYRNNDKQDHRALCRIPTPSN